MRRERRHSSPAFPFALQFVHQRPVYLRNRPAIRRQASDNRDTKLPFNSSRRVPSGEFRTPSQGARAVFHRWHRTLSHRTPRNYPETEGSRRGYERQTGLPGANYRRRGRRGRRRRRRHSPPSARHVLSCLLRRSNPLEPPSR